ncbi:MAG: hypothetical protein ACUVXA_15595 [Candidatus Jordarchaeum sp.]|uniref:hypothetical protein n=1 Tax=Candidatus Jordarchaeum sp. TaxID=2823881 RepID=UPI00404AAC1E
MPLKAKLMKIFTRKRVTLIILAIIIGVFAWFDYWAIYFDNIFYGPIAAAVHFYCRSWSIIPGLIPWGIDPYFSEWIPFISYPIYPTHVIQEYSQGGAPLALFLVASLGNGLPDGLLNTGIVAGLFIVGKDLQLEILIYMGVYDPLRAGFFATYGIVLTMIAMGVIGGFFAQFQVYSLMWKSYVYSFKKPLVILTWLIFISAPFVLGALAGVKFITPTQLQFGPWTIYYNEVLILCFVYAFITSAFSGYFTKRFWSGAFIGGTISLASFAGILGKGVQELLYGIMWIPYHITVQGGVVQYYQDAFGVWQANLTIAYTAIAATFIVISALWGGFWASMGRVSTYTETTPEMKTPQGLAFMYRDLWSNYFLLGKNKVDEFEVVTKGAKALLRRLFRREKKFKTFEHMDRVPRDGKPTLPVHELEIISQEDNKAKVRLRNTGEEIGTFYDPNYLAEKYKPVWNPFELAYQAAVAKWIIPLIGILIAVATVYFVFAVQPYLQYVTLPGDLWRYFTTGEVRILVVAALVIYVFILVFSIYWAVHSRKILSESPEGAPAVIAIGVFSSIAFIFTVYIFLRMADFLSIMILNSPFFRQYVLGETPLQIATTPSLLDQYTTLAALPFEIMFSAMLYGILFLLIASFILGLSGVQVLGLERYTLYFYANQGPLFPYKDREDAPVWVEGKYYWVMRFTYLWPGEFTVSSRSLYHEDYERVEVWVNAETGVLEWIVSDYHWRELFYRVPDDGKDHRIIVDFNANFHTPDFALLHPEELEDFEVEDPLRAAFSLSMDWIRKGRQRTRELFKNVSESVSSSITGRDVKYAIKTRSQYVDNYLVDIAPGIRRAAANVCAKLPWSFWRYPLGVPTIDPKTGKYYYREDKYFPPPIDAPLHPIKKKVDGVGTSAVLNEQVCANCFTLNTLDLKSSQDKNWQCKKCGEDMRRQSMIH